MPLQNLIEGTINSLQLKGIIGMKYLKIMVPKQLNAIFPNIWTVHNIWFLCHKHQHSIMIETCSQKVELLA